MRRGCYHCHRVRGRQQFRSGVAWPECSRQLSVYQVCVCVCVCVCVYLPVCQSAYTRAHTSTQILSVANDAIDRVVVTNAGSGYRGTITLVLDVYASCVYHDLQPQPSGYVDAVTVLSRWMLMLVFGCGRACLYSCVAVLTQIWCSAAVLGTHRRRDW